jgi:hypothetical protein
MKEIPTRTHKHMLEMTREKKHDLCDSQPADMARIRDDIIGRSDHLFVFMKFEVKMVYSVSSVSDFSKLKDEIQSILDGECDAGNLAQMHNKVALLSTQNTLNTGGQDEDLTALVNFIGHAAYI